MDDGKQTYTLDGIIQCEKCGHTNVFEVTGIELSKESQPLGEMVGKDLIKFIRQNLKKHPIDGKEGV